MSERSKIHYKKPGIGWLHEKLNARQFLIFSSVLVGLCAGLAAVLLKSFVHVIRKYVVEGYLFHFNFKYIYLLLPFLGIGLTVFIVHRFFRGKMHRGTTNILFSIAKKGSFLPFEQVYSHIITSGITIGFGGSAGLESPIVSTGSAIGSNYSRRYKLTYKERTLLLAAGAAGGIAAAFNAPIAGVLFALEVLLVDINISSFIPLLIASASGALISKIILQENILLSFRLRQPFDYHNVPYYILLGFLAGIASLYHVTLYDKTEHRFEQMKSGYSRWIIGSSLLALIFAFFPSLFGEGYESIKNLASLNPHFLYKDSLFAPLLENRGLILLFIGLTFLLKAMAVGITLGSGGNGGNFAPALFVGAGLGFVFASLLQLTGLTDVPLANLTLVAMAGILSGVFHAPLTAIFLIAEITGGYELMIPLMIVSAISYVVVKYFHPDSLEIKNLKKKGTIISEDRDTSILGRIEIYNLIEKDFSEVQPDDKLRLLVDAVKHSRRNIFPVVKKNRELEGIIFLDDIKEEMFNMKLYETVLAKELMHKPVARISNTDDIFQIMKKFEESGQWNLPYTKNGEYVGFLSKSSILSKYRNELLNS